MAYDNTRPGGVLFKNDKKKKDTHPDRHGNITIDDACLDHLISARAAGKPLKLELSGWVKNGSSGQYLSLSAKVPWEPTGERSSPPAASRPSSLDLDDEIPFK